MPYEIVFWVMAAVTGFSLLYPWHPAWPAAKWLVHLPVLLIPLWLLYEMLMPGHMNIRFDIPLLIMGVGLSIAVYLSKLILFAIVRRNRRSGGAFNDIELGGGTGNFPAP